MVFQFKEGNDVQLNNVLKHYHEISDILKKRIIGGLNCNF